MYTLENWWGSQLSLPQTTETEYLNRIFNKKEIKNIHRLRPKSMKMSGDKWIKSQNYVNQLNKIQHCVVWSTKSVIYRVINWWKTDDTTFLNTVARLICLGVDSFTQEIRFTLALDITVMQWLTSIFSTACAI